MIGTLIPEPLERGSLRIDDLNSYREAHMDTQSFSFPVTFVTPVDVKMNLNVQAHTQQGWPGSGLAVEEVDLGGKSPLEAPHRYRQDC